VREIRMALEFKAKLCYMALEFKAKLCYMALEFKAKLCSVKQSFALNSNEPDKTELTEY
jgi:hypothetical protein